MIKIKLCGLQKEEDILCANDLKTDYIGFVFAKNSRRCVSPKQAVRLKALLHPDIKAVGVFVDAKPNEISELVKCGTIDLIQLHGSENEEYIQQLRKIPLSGTGKTIPKIIKAFRMGAENAGRMDCGTKGSFRDGERKDRSVEKLLDQIHRTSADFILLDSSDPGSGRSFDRSILKSIQRDYFLAGGLHAENVGEILKTVQPFGVDVSSGVESNGSKDPAKMKRFVEAVRNIR